MALVRPLLRNPFFRGADGTPEVMARDKEVTVLPIDWSLSLADGETITASTWQPNGTALSAEAFTDTTTTATVTDSYGDPTNLVTTSTGRVLSQEIRVRSVRGWRCCDYGS